MSIGRLNGDGQMDIVVDCVCNPTPVGGEGKGPEYQPCASFDVYYGLGDNQLVKRTVVTDPSVYDFGVPYAVDVNGDGYGDLAVSGSLGCDCRFGLFVWQGNADGSFQQTPQPFISNTNSVGWMAVADFNRDGMMDFAMGGRNEYLINTTPRAACGTYIISPSVTACQPVDNTYSPSPVSVEVNSYDTTNLSAGTHSLVFKLWDAGGDVYTATKTITVN